MKLISLSTGDELKKGATVKTFRGEEGMLMYFWPPHKPSSTGRVGVEINGQYCEFYPGVIDAQFQEVE
jgi:hypothetical protein